ncbi:MAG TPA: sigma-70 family RNA polymerase sigma factor [Sphingobacterium sp.]|nr:sigma-70 family RNA polymerase sigma factor [Sphingobacterium sp.]
MLADKKSDQELIQAYIEGDEKALEALLYQYKDKIYTSIYIRLKDHFIAEDVFQETFIKIINTLKSGKYNHEGKFLPWAMRIAYNLVMDHFRKMKRTPPVVNNEGFDIFEILNFSEDDAEVQLIKQQRDRDLKKVIQMLPDEQKEVLIMRHYCEMSFKEIADITDVSINTALGRMRYALSNMRKLIEENNLVLQS